jgi:hypothetical protein
MNSFTEDVALQRVAIDATLRTSPANEEWD